MNTRLLAPWLTLLLAAGCFSPNVPITTDGGASAGTTETGGGSALTLTSESESESTGGSTITGGTNPSDATTDPTTGAMTTIAESSGSDENGTSSSDQGESSSTTMPPAECGNAVVEPGELCDDGTNDGADVGDCAPDCSSEVELREIVSSANVFAPTFTVLGEGSVIQNLDDQCPFGYRAMFSDGVDRIASVAANAGDGQVDWVLAPWTAYVNEDGDLLAITDAAALLGVHDGIFSNLANAISPGDNTARWTGLNQDWTALQANENCNNWSNATTNYQMMTGSPGVTTAGFIRQSQDYTFPCNNATRAIYCVEP